MQLFFKVLMRQGSDSANLDRMVQLFTSGGLSLAETLRRFMMPPWRGNPELDVEIRSYYEGCRRALGNLAVMEGPSVVVALDDDTMVAVSAINNALKRRGLAP